MKIITFQGGLGNQMFQFQFYLWLKRHISSKIYGYYPKGGLMSHNGLEIEDCISNVTLPPTNIMVAILVKGLKFLNFIGVKCISNASSFSLKRILFEDYWQDLSYVEHANFNFNVSLISQNSFNSDIYQKIISSNSVSIHIRRGDYITDKFSGIYSGVCDVEYYKRAIEYIYSKVENPTFYIFSDDTEWTKSNIIISNGYYIDWNKNNNSYFDMFLMNQCKHSIIANSTFSWWGAYNDSKNKDGIVISPRKWFASNLLSEPLIFPTTWIRL